MELDRTRRMPEAPLMAVSMGKVTSISTSSGAMPWHSVIMVTVGAVRSGNTSTGRSRAIFTPRMVMNSAENTTTALFLRLFCINWSSI